MGSYDLDSRFNDLGGLLHARAFGLCMTSVYGQLYILCRYSACLAAAVAECRRTSVVLSGCSSHLMF